MIALTYIRSPGAICIEDAIRTCAPILPGLHIFPVRGKQPIAPGWADYAAAEPGARRDLARRFPTRTGWAVACRPSGILVVDIDNRPPDRDGRGQWTAFLAAHPDDAATRPGVTVATRSGGVHLWFSFPWGWDSPQGARIGNSCDRLGPGIDIRAGRGASGGLAVFAAVDRIAHIVGPLTPPPPELLSAVADAPSPSAAATRPPLEPGRVMTGLRHAADRLAHAATGNRNALLNWAAFKPGREAIAAGFSRQTVEAILREAADMAGVPHREAEATIRSGLDAPAMDRRGIDDE